MKKIIQLLCVLFAVGTYSATYAACPSEPGCNTNWLNVPGDFSNPVNNFSMYLLSGQFNLDFPGGTGVGGVTPLNTVGKQIDFTATQFDHIGAGQGTSLLDASFNHYDIGSAVFFGVLATIYMDGPATGSLVDTAGSAQGHWTLNPHLYANWNGLDMDLGIVPITTDATVSYTVGGVCDPDTGICTPAYNATSSGSLMDYHSGLAYMVGQTIMQGGPFQGLRVTFGFQGQDPLAAPSSVVPVPASAWLFGSGLLGLIGVARKRKAA